jgi:protocatechuate 3,4-dioxygenase beta subunit
MHVRWIVVFLALLTFVVRGGPSQSIATLAGPDEPGTRLIISGWAFDPSGVRPAPGVTLYAYHTDITGVYNRRGLQEPRLKGTVVTDAQGRFEWRTIRPMPYPGRDNPAHIHVKATGGGYPEQWFEVLFSDDTILTPQQRAESKAAGKFGSIVTTTRNAKGVLHATFNIRLSKNPAR